MKKIKENKGEIHEYFFEDWLEGYIPTSWFKHPGEHKITNEFRQVHYDRISIDEFNKIYEAARKRFYQRVEEEFVSEKKYLSKKIKLSLDIERYVDHEIQKFEWRCGITEKKPSFPFNSMYYHGDYKTMYLQHKIHGKEAEYFHTNSENYKINANMDYRHIMFEVEWKMWCILKELKRSGNYEILNFENPILEVINFNVFDKWITPFKNENIISESDFLILKNALLQYFENGNFPSDLPVIKIKKVNKKRFGWALRSMYSECKSNNEYISKEYLVFAKNHISIFADVDLNENDLINSTLYKYFTTKTL